MNYFNKNLAGIFFFFNLKITGTENSNRIKLLEPIIFQFAIARLEKMK
jgi:hypothetical protein